VIGGEAQIFEMFFGLGYINILAPEFDLTSGGEMTVN
jgi:hypothetical protein